MTRHIADQQRSRGASRLVAFLRQDKAMRPSPGTIALQSRPKPRTPEEKTTRFLEISRGKTV